MPIIHIPAETRGLTELNWLASYHSFSFGEYFNPDKMAFGKLRVLNDDTVAPGKGFGMHFHDNMEIVTIVLSGSLEHQDSTGGKGVLKAGQMQRMTAGKGIQHSEYNPSQTEPVHFLQIWVLPASLGLKPEYEQKEFTPLLKADHPALLVSPDKKKGALFIHQDVEFKMAEMKEGAEVVVPIGPGNRGVYAFLIEGKVQIGKTVLNSRDAAAIVDEKQFTLRAVKPSKVLLIETPMNG